MIIRQLTDSEQWAGYLSDIEMMIKYQRQNTCLSRLSMLSFLVIKITLSSRICVPVLIIQVSITPLLLLPTTLTFAIVS